MESTIRLGAGASRAGLPLSVANRHVLVTGSTGTGKTVSLLALAHRLSQAGVPVFFPDLKGDVGKLAPCSPLRLIDRLTFSASRLEPSAVGRALDVSETQAEALAVAWEAGSNAKRFDTLDDVKAVVRAMRATPRAFEAIGHVTATTAAVLARSLLTFERDGGGELLGSPSFDVARLLDLDDDGRGFVNVWTATRFGDSGRAYGLAVSYVLGELFHRLPECGDLDKPRAVLIFDEAHMLFDGATGEQIAEIARRVRTLRSKGVGLVFASQSPADLPPLILAQLGSRIQHGLRSASAADERALRVAVSTLPGSDRHDFAAAVRGLRTGEALVSFLAADGRPGRTELATIAPPPCPLNVSPDLSAVPRLTVAASPPSSSSAPSTANPFVELPIAGGILFWVLALLLSFLR